MWGLSITFFQLTLWNSFTTKNCVSSCPVYIFYCYKFHYSMKNFREDIEPWTVWTLTMVIKPLKAMAKKDSLWFHWNSGLIRLYSTVAQVKRKVLLKCESQGVWVLLSSWNSVKLNHKLILLCHVSIHICLSLILCLLPSVTNGGKTQN